MRDDDHPEATRLRGFLLNMETRTEYVLRDGALIVRSVAEESMGDQGALVMSLLGEGYLATKGKEVVTVGSRSYPVAYVHNAKRGTTDYMLVGLGSEITVDSFMLTQHPDGKITPCPWHRANLTNTTLTCAFKARLIFPGQLILALCLTPVEAGEYVTGFINKTQTRLFLRKDGVFYPAPLPHVNAAATLCSGSFTEKGNQRLGTSLLEAAKTFIEEGLQMSQWRGHWTEGFSEKYAPNVWFDGGIANITYGAIGRPKAPPAWWTDSLKNLP